MKKASHVECLPDGTQLLHQGVIETGEMFVLQRADDRFGERDGARLDRVAGKFATLDENFRKDRERVFDESATRLFEMRGDECVVNLVKRSRKLFAVTASPSLAADETADLASGEMNFAANRFAVVGMFF